MFCCSFRFNVGNMSGVDNLGIEFACNKAKSNVIRQEFPDRREISWIDVIEAIQLFY